MKRGDIYWLDLDPTLGHEQSGFRPVVIVAATAFNLASKLPVVVPITNGGAFAERLGFAVSLKDAGLKTTGIIRCDQPRTVDIAQRHGKFIEALPESLLDEIMARVSVIFE
ncbi:type II toxin-antitoxin system PemK/MazF family toxin [Mannheimia haemolytica]|uniref:type II toxin-antitoxin system PemK/MazF family toxin n=1 Tax=Mannheimia haemolytica TaxID=75985 RepID=UPI00201C8941|nr:type II toxin-antitoxin system PemK/MazF family toxin [Mannheimia haemolytica]UQX70158.1 type II toxin-antitoxin system PemK/MazF family toxin [Mannheimia haemolytica]